MEQCPHPKKKPHFLSSFVSYYFYCCVKAPITKALSSSSKQSVQMWNQHLQTMTNVGMLSRNGNTHFQYTVWMTA